VIVNTPILYAYVGAPKYSDFSVIASAMMATNLPISTIFPFADLYALPLAIFPVWFAFFSLLADLPVFFRHFLAISTPFSCLFC
jgi:hypothetical protein